MALKYSDLASEVNQFMTNEAIKPYLANLPNYANMVGSRTENISQQLKGQLPQDVINQIGQQAAERGVGGGNPGSPNANAAYLRALGLNSLQMQQQGNQNLSTAIADTPVPELFNPMSLVVPEILANQTLGAAQSGVRSGGGGVQTASSSGPGFTRSAPTAAYNPGPNMTVYGPQGGQEQPSSDPYANWWNSYGVTQSQPNYGATDTFDPLAYTYASGGQYGGSVDWGSLYQDTNMPAGWADQNWGGVFNEIDASNPDNAFMFE